MTQVLDILTTLLTKHTSTFFEDDGVTVCVKWLKSVGRLIWVIWWIILEIFCILCFVCFSAKLTRVDCIRVTWSCVRVLLFRTIPAYWVMTGNWCTRSSTASIMGCRMSWKCKHLQLTCSTVASSPELQENSSTTWCLPPVLPPRRWKRADVAARKEQTKRIR